MIQAIFFDIDGTLITFGAEKMSDVTIDTLRRLKEQGIRIFIATGRATVEMDLITKDMDFDGYVTLNGQLCMDHDWKCYYGNPMHPDDRKQIQETFEKKEIPIYLVTENRSFINILTDPVVNIHKMFNIKKPAVEEYHGEPIYQLNLYEDEAAVEEFMKKIPHSQARRWHSKGYDVFSKTGSKMVGIEKTLEHYGIRREEIMAFGDGSNDIEMLQFAGIGVAMGNAVPEAKAAADYVTCNVEDEGIFHAVQHFGLL